MKKLSGYIFSMMLVLVSLIVIDVLVMFFICVQKEKKYLDTYRIEKVSEKIVNEGGVYNVDQSIYDRLDRTGSFAMIIDDSGNVIWNYNKPAEIPDFYGIKEVASFSHWYLNDYPIYNWARDDGILVVGHPKGSIWKYILEINMETMDGMIRFGPYMLIANMLILLLLPVLITRKWMLAREKARTEWIAGVSHDIRTPLSIVMGSVEKGSIEEKQCFKIRDLIGNLNTENKLESGTGKWSSEKINLTSILRDILCDYINTYEDYSFDLEVDEQLENYSIQADVTLIRRMIENLITNSIVHNEKGCEMKVTLSERGNGKAKLAICDNGQGAPEQKIKVLNERIKNAYLPEHGLGIRVVKQVAKKYKYAVKFSAEENEYFKCEIDL
ncbi:sensor histidine kinase [Butyrivibrio sp. AE3003]|uniref:sensor histidine kinase n=1 Tax=Butyrivibrio sp. AE3003 TaxID=1496721 RepID=UPI00047B874C|nr:HAMP domain-containing sensor histidine kinase [Butyrivibrio sp. AE3003]